MRRVILFASAALAAIPVFAQTAPLLCVTTANPPIVRAEALAERLGDIVLSCSGGPAGGTVTTNLTVSLAVNATNHINSNGNVDAVLTVDTTPANVPATLAAVNSVVWQGLAIPFSASGTANLRIANLRGNATQAAGSVVLAYLALNGPTSIPVTNGQFTVAVPQASAYSSFGVAAVCDQNGSPLPSTPNVPNFLAAGTLRSGVRLTEGFASAFAPKSDWSNFNADTGVRVMLKYSGAPSFARLFAPVFVAGSTADIPTAAGDLGVAASGGRYTPGKNELLFALVTGADANGAGGTVAPPPTSTTDLTDVAEVAMTGGAGYVVYEVVDANQSARESAQFPSFLTADPVSNGGTYSVSTSISLAPVSQAATAVAGAPIPRFTGAAPGSDCSLIGDCTALYFGKLAVEVPEPIVVNTTTDKNITRWFMVRNSGGGILQWTTSVNYTNATGWLRVAPASSTGDGALVFDVLPANLQPGTYQANIVVSAGNAGVIPVPVTLNVSAPAPATPAINALTSAADSRLNAAPGSLATLYGSHLTGQTVAVTFDGNPANILFSNDTQINVLVPQGTGLSPKVVATVNGVPSQQFAGTLSAIAPAIFAGAVVNQDGSVNSESNPAKPGTTVVLYGTGEAGAARVTARVHDVDIMTPIYGGPAPTLPGVQQVNLTVPEGLPSMQTFVYLCGSADAGSARVCSPAQKIWLQR